MTTRTTIHLALLTSLAISACRPAAMIGPEPNEPATQPTATGAAQHHAAAKREEARLARHQELYDPHAARAVRRCDPAGGGARGQGEPICWLETINPTKVHLQEMEAHRLRAAEHRRAARELRATEERACAGVSPDDRDISPFAHRGDILGVSPLRGGDAAAAERPIVGATVVFRPVPGLTATELQHVLDCHLARNATIGYELASREMHQCLLTQPGSQVSVRALAAGFAVDVRANDAFGGREIWRRAQTLAAVD